MQTLFDASNQQERKRQSPLAERMRPRSLDEIAGQKELVQTGSAFRTLIESGNILSLIFWGPPGSGKTTLAKVIAQQSNTFFCELSAVNAGLADVRRIIQEADLRLTRNHQRTILFIDEIHRFNKAQQDAFLPWVENGTLTLIGATTENPSFEVNAALLSRCKVFVLHKLEAEDIKMILLRALQDTERGVGNLKLHFPENIINELIIVADGDARVALNALELVVNSVSSQKDGKTIEPRLEDTRAVLQRSHHLYDASGEEHYNIISALHKSLRGSDIDASLYWLGRMLESGEDPIYIARRLVRFASEDIGLADPQALLQAVAGYQACHCLGIPECNVHLAQVVVYLAKAPKSNALYAAYQRVKEDVERLPNEPVPLHIRNAPTKLMKHLGYGNGYKYNPDYEGPVDQEYLPKRLKGRKYFEG